jgi:hypothetical protein
MPLLDDGRAVGMAVLDVRVGMAGDDEPDEVRRGRKLCVNGRPWPAECLFPGAADR